MSEGGSPPTKIAPSPTSAQSPTSELASQMNRAINIPMLSSPESDPGYDDRSDDPLSSPENEMVIDSSGYQQYHSQTGTRQGFPPNYTATNPNYVPQLGTSPPNYTGNFVPINQVYAPGTAPVLDQPPNAYIASDPIAIPQTGFSPPNDFSPPGNENINNVFASFFTSQQDLIADITNPLNQETWMDLYVPTQANLSWENQGAWQEGFNEMQPVYSTQSNEGGQYDARRSSIFAPTVHYLS